MTTDGKLLTDNDGKGTSDLTGKGLLGALSRLRCCCRTGLHRCIADVCAYTCATVFLSGIQRCADVYVDPSEPGSERYAGCPLAVFDGEANGEFQLEYCGRYGHSCVFLLSKCDTVAARAVARLTGHDAIIGDYVGERYLLADSLVLYLTLTDRESHGHRWIEWQLVVAAHGYKLSCCAPEGGLGVEQCHCYPHVRGWDGLTRRGYEPALFPILVTRGVFPPGEDTNTDSLTATESLDCPPELNGDNLICAPAATGSDTATATDTCTDYCPDYERVDVGFYPHQGGPLYIGTPVGGLIGGFNWGHGGHAQIRLHNTDSFDTGTGTDTHSTNCPTPEDCDAYFARGCGSDTSTFTFDPCLTGTDTRTDTTTSTSTDTSTSTSTTTDTGTDTCTETCQPCGDCPPYGPSGTSLLLDLGAPFGFCDDCAGGIEGVGCCVSNSPPSDCKVCGGPSGIDCTCIAVVDKADCLANGWTWCCRGSGGTGSTGVSPCNGANVTSLISLPIVSFTTTTRTYSKTVGTDVFTVVQTCGVGMVADVFELTVIRNGRCKIHAIIAGSCTGFSGSAFTYEDTGLTNGTCASNGSGHATGLITRGCCR